jgi:hypothetical protein
MADNNKRDRDYRPEQGQESNQNWDDMNDDRQQKEQPGTEQTSTRTTNEELSSSGAGSSQRDKDDNVGPLQSDLNDLTSEKRMDRGSNLTGPGLG